MDAAFLPRAIIRVDRLPRSGAGKIARASLDEIYDAWACRKADVMRRLDFEVRVAADHPSLQGHFPGNPIVPGVVLLDTVIANVELATGSPKYSRAAGQISLSATAR